MKNASQDFTSMRGILILILLYKKLYLKFAREMELNVLKVGLCHLKHITRIC